MTEQQIPQLVTDALVTHQHHFASLSIDDARWVIQNTEAAIALCVETIKSREFVVTKKAISLVRIAQTELCAVPEIETSACLRDCKWAYRAADFDTLLPPTQPAQTACIVATYQPVMPMTFADIAAAVCDVTVKTSFAESLKLLKERGLTLSFSQLEKLVELQERGVETGIRTDGWASLAFVECADGSISPVSVFYDCRGWNGLVAELSINARWSLVASRLLLRNSNAATL